MGDASTFTTRPQLQGDFGMASSTHWLASSSAMAMLERGGTAFDAAVAAGFVLQVVEPHLNGPGGEVPIILYDSATEETVVLAGQGPAPDGATLEHFADLGLDVIPGSGLLPACVPGAFDAWMTLLSRGVLSLRDVLEPAIGYATRGFATHPRLAATIDGVTAHFLEHWPTSAATWLDDGRGPVAGTRVRNPVLAATYERLLTEAEARSSDRDGQIAAARDVFYRGFVAEAMVAFATTEIHDSSGRRHAGLLSGDDLDRWVTPVEAPVTFDYRSLRVHKTGPWGQGPVFCQQLALLSGFDLDDLETDGVELVHLVIESAKLAFADREAYYGDPAFVEVPLDDLLSSAYADARRKEIGTEARHDLLPGAPGGRTPVLPSRLPLGEGIDVHATDTEPTVNRHGTRGDTCHLDVADRHGNFVSATPSGGWLQSSPTIPALGFPLGTRGQMFWLEPGLASSLAPGKRPRTTLTPTMVHRDGRPYLAFGTPGGDQQDQWSLIAFLRHVHHGLGIQAAIDAPTFHSLHMPSSFAPRARNPLDVVIESRFPKESLAGLEDRGHHVVRSGAWSLSRLCAVGRGGDGMLQGAADPRAMQCYAVGR